jgi:hypothetical protein
MIDDLPIFDHKWASAAALEVSEKSLARGSEQNAILRQRVLSNV